MHITKVHVSKHLAPKTRELFPLFGLALCFFLGMVGGYLYAGYSVETTAEALKEYVTGYCRLFQEGGSGGVSFLTMVRLFFGYGLAAFLLGFTAIGVLALPAVSFAYGFSLMFATACFVGLYGREGALLAISALGVRVLFTLPVFLYLGGKAWVKSFYAVSLFRGKRGAAVTYDGGYVFRLLVCIALTILGICMELWLTPWLFHSAISQIPIG